MQISIQVKGFKKVMASLKNLEQDLEKPFREVIAGGAQLIRGEAIKSIQSGPKSGRIYEKYNPRRTHKASAPGQAPASDTGNLVRNIVVKQENPDLVKVSSLKWPTLQPGETLNPGGAKSILSNVFSSVIFLY